MWSEADALRSYSLSLFLSAHPQSHKHPLGSLLRLLLQAVNDEALAFQREKQVRLNQVEVVLLLRLHQIEYLQEGQLPSDLSGALLFSNTELDKLKHRVRVSCGHTLQCQREVAVFAASQLL